MFIVRVWRLVGTRMWWNSKTPCEKLSENLCGRKNTFFLMVHISIEIKHVLTQFFFFKVTQKINLDRYLFFIFFKLIKVHFWLFEKVHFYIFAILKKKIMRYDQNQKYRSRYIFCANLKKKIKSIHALVQKICVPF